MKRRMIVMMFGCGLLFGIVSALSVATQTPAKKNTSKVILENSRVRVKDAYFMPGDTKPGMHTHSLPHVGVVIEGGTLKFNYPNGKSETLELPRGAAGYRDANVTHEAVNIGTKPVRVIEVEIK